jgi:anti-anti-sigma factor
VEEFVVRAREDGRGTVITVSGELDAVSAPQFELLLTTADQPVLVDLAGVEFMDSSGLSSLVRATKAGVEIELRDPQGSVRRTLEVTGLDSYWPIHDGAHPR